MKKFGIKFEEKGGRFYSEVIDQKDFAKKLPDIKKNDARFITATALKNSAEEIFVYYHFEIDKKVYPVRNRPAKGTATVASGLSASNGVYTFKTKVFNNAKSISSDFPSAGWIEREICEFYKIKISGQIKKPLLYS